MEKGRVNIKKRRASPRFIIRFLAISALSLLTLHIGLYFGSDLLLRNYLQGEVNKISDGKYSVDFDRFNLSLFERGFYIQGFTLIPVDESVVEKAHQPFYRVTVPQISIKRISYNFSSNVLTIGQLNLQEPGIQSRQSDDFIEDPELSRLKQLEIEIRKSLGERLRSIVISNFFIQEADLLLENFISQRSIKADNTNLYVQDLRFSSQIEETAPVNIQGFSLDLQNFEMTLADSVHTIRAIRADISSLDQFIKVDKIKINPDLSRPAATYYEIEVENLALSEADIHQMFVTTDVNIGTLTLHHPKFHIYTQPSKGGEGTYSPGGLYPLMEDILASITVADLTIEAGQYSQSTPTDPDLNRIEADKINFKMDRVYIGPDESRMEDRFFYAMDASVDISNVKVALADDIHWISGEKVVLSSFDDLISVDNVKVEPILEDEQETDIPLFEIEIPSVRLANANLKKTYNESILDMEEMTLISPSVLIRDFDTSQNRGAKKTLQELTKDYLRAIYINRLVMEEGNLVLDNKLRIRQDSLSFGKISFVLEDFRLDEKIETDESPRIFLAKDLELEVEDYALKLSDNLHLFATDKILINTKEDFIKIEGFSLKPQNSINIPATLSRYSKTTILDIEVPDFYVRGVDISEAFFHGNLFVKEIEVPSPIIKLQIHKNLEDEEDETRVDRGDILNLLTGYFSVVQVGAVKVDNGTLHLENFGEDNVQTFAENDVTINIRDFYVDEFIDYMDSRTLFAQELDIRLNNHVFNIAEGKYSITAEGISFNSAKEEIHTTNVRLRPRVNLDAQAAIEATIPSMSIQGVDLEGFLFENTLSMSNLKLSGATVNLTLNRQAEKEEVMPRTPRHRERNLPKTIDIIKIDTVEAEDAQFNLAYKEDSQTMDLVNSGVNLSFYGFLLDSAKLMKGDIAAFFSAMTMEMDSLSLSLRDSIHTVHFSKIDLDTKTDEVVFSDFTITPKDQMGKKGLPVVDAKIPRVTLQTRALHNLQSTGDLIIQQLLLSEPSIILYMDADEAVKLTEDQTEKPLSQTVVENLMINNFEIKGGSLSLREKGKPQEAGLFDNLSLTFNDLEFDLSSPSAFKKDFYLNKDFNLELSDYELKLPDSLNILRVGYATLSMDQLDLKDVELVPRYGNYQYTRKVGHQTDVARVKIPWAVLKGFNLEKMVQDNSIEAQTAYLRKPIAVVFRDKRYDMEEGVQKPMPQELMVNGALNVKLDSLIIEDGTVTYREFPVGGMVPGELNFLSLDAVMAPFYIIKDSVDYPIPSNFLQASSLLNGEAPISLSAELFYQRPYPIEVSVEVGEFELSLLNSMIETNAFASVLEGVVRGGKWHFVADEHDARGVMGIRYNDLKLRLLEERTLTRGRGRKNVLTFVINNLAVRRNNPRPIFNRMVTSPIYYERDKSRFIFNYLWKSTLTGLGGSVGLGKPEIPKEQK